MGEIYSIDKVSVRLIKDAPLLSDVPLHSPEQVVNVFSKELAECDREVVAVLFLNAADCPICLHIASIGSLTESVVSPREIMKVGILTNASSMILMHNHPSGSPLPSKHDTAVTHRMYQVCELMNIPLLDHIIIGNGLYFSFREKDILTGDTLHFKTNYQSDIFPVAGAVAEKKENKYE